MLRWNRQKLFLQARKCVNHLTRWKQGERRLLQSKSLALSNRFNRTRRRNRWPRPNPLRSLRNLIRNDPLQLNHNSNVLSAPIVAIIETAEAGEISGRVIHNNSGHRSSNARRSGHNPRILSNSGRERRHFGTLMLPCAR
ncbi:hypothetical protein Cflav_PD5859 [Pedosphaera parvula Ellin514]|uniref:Uncharacterized protein n=1 Tax=Pedosphaera parvula (strain Ellin514) TaxID=320771 RepID=B9X9R6_PEDPL|nr:hypothetical protein Cflav_PD5859 [Pedosphaera parvula Ellin514]